MAVELEDCYPHIFKYYRADLEDNFRADIVKHFQPVIDFINDCKRKNGRVLVHCAMGVSRSTTAVIAYLIKELGYTYDDARKYVKERRGIIQPNFGFSKALKEYSAQIHGNNKPTAISSPIPIESLSSSPPRSILSSSNNSIPVLSSSSTPIITNSDGLIVNNPCNTNSLINSAL
ncbi:putative protein tyrosine phosphatase [Heterostelium album PN500]|uniref:protein-tyrosine-phosphatase n=1 Tax=Heterostelium pallidum (strain ATCC 26659 / Pp 5 / PN500) TaxID=670386 RepID=D3B6Q8_HETP5|nr:putative protein tyrosine phosphatase [Heterostelium album PN500]EFA83028.1 putative protein tyrosine phosphatase [Heterostelium album PN500]|eukprot:XP_020435145.1 putative protein tyrosine phosphatase [Heterostelium album PN500]